MMNNIVKYYVLYGTMYREDCIDADKLHGIYDTFTLINQHHISVPEGVTGIGEEAFSGFSRMKSITIPSSVSRIDDSAFAGCGDIVIRGKRGSAAERFAESHAINFAETD